MSGEESERGTRPREKGWRMNTWRPGMMVSHWDPAWDEEDPAEAARAEREWRAMTPAQKAWGLAGAILILSPIIAMFALMPFAFAASGETRDRLERIMVMLFLAQFAVCLLVIVVARLLPRRKPGTGTTRSG